MEKIESCEMVRYSCINEKNKREIVLLRGKGCSWRKCRFCDYHLDRCDDEEQNVTLNEKQLSRVTGCYGTLEVINSGSFCDLDERTMELIEAVCKNKKINQVHFECHWRDRDCIESLRKRFAKIRVQIKIKIGVETFDALFRESYLVKGIDTDSPKLIASYGDEVCLLQGIPGQSVERMKRDIEIGLQYFERVCVNIMVENSTMIKPDPAVIKLFQENIYPDYIENERVDILMENTEFGVGGMEK